VTTVDNFADPEPSWTPPAGHDLLYAGRLSEEKGLDSLIEAFASGPLSAYSELLTFVVFALAMMVRQTGIFGERTVDRA